MWNLLIEESPLCATYLANGTVRSYLKDKSSPP